jgi:putative tryptophan/tyrosine transport system substrate-binding protein
MVNLKRREFITLLAGMSAAWSVVVHAQQRPNVVRLGVLIFSTPEADPQMKTVRVRLRELGYVEGKNLTMIYRYAEGKYERLADLARELIDERPELVLALGGDVAHYATNATSTTPIVFISSADPVQLGLTVSIARPGRNATGVTLLLDDTASKRLELLKEVAPRVKRTAFLWNPDHPDNELREAQRAAPALQMELQLVEVRGSADFKNAFRAMSDAQPDALYVVSSRHTVLNMSSLVDFARTKRIPLIGGWGAWARAGGLLSFGPNTDEMARHAADYVGKIINGTNPVDLPVQQPTRFELVINTKAAKEIGIEVPATLLARADEVIE